MWKIIAPAWPVVNDLMADSASPSHHWIENQAFSTNLTLLTRLQCIAGKRGWTWGPQTYLLCILIFSIILCLRDPPPIPTCESSCRPEEECREEDGIWGCFCRQNISVSGEQLSGLVATVLGGQGRKKELWRARRRYGSKSEVWN